jgi:hypothetical protein
VNRGQALRVGAGLAAVLMVAWLADALRAVDLDDQGRAVVRASGPSPTPGEVARARALFERAGRRNPDPRPQLDEAALLLTAGDSRGAAQILEGVVDRNPGSVRGWSLLATAAAPFDARRSLEANGELLKLYGRIPGQLGSGVLRTPSGVRYRVVPGHAKGFVAFIRRSGDVVTFAGWAGLPGAHIPVKEVLVVAHGRVVRGTPPTMRWPGVRPADGGTRTGFRIGVPIAALRNGSGEVDAHLFGAGLGAASLLAVSCKRPQFIGC